MHSSRSTRLYENASPQCPTPLRLKIWAIGSFQHCRHSIPRGTSARHSSVLRQQTRAIILRGRQLKKKKCGSKIWKAVSNWSEAVCFATASCLCEWLSTSNYVLQNRIEKITADWAMWCNSEAKLYTSTLHALTAYCTFLFTCWHGSLSLCFAFAVAIGTLLLTFFCLCPVLCDVAHVQTV